MAGDNKRSGAIARLLARYLQAIPAQLQECEQRFAAVTEGDWDPEAVFPIFKTMHNLVGTAGSFGLDQISETALPLELMLKELRAGSEPPTAEQQDRFEVGVAQLKQAVARVREAEELD